MFTNTRPLWHPPGARGIYGGAVIAHCLAAAQQTVPSNFTVHSMHCYFVLAGDSEIPVMYYVEHVREGRSFATRTVQARQRGKCIFTTTMSFARENSGGSRTITHAIPMPDDIPPPPADDEIEEIGKATWGRPFVSHQVEILNTQSENPHEKKTRQWIKAAGEISPEAGHEIHISALAYMSDSYFIGTISRIHGLWRHWSPDRKNKGEAKESPSREPTKKERRAKVGMMVSLDHSIYFHQPRKFRADEWMFAEMSSPWSGDGRGVVTQHMYARDGTLIATCFQEVCLYALGLRWRTNIRVGSCETATGRTFTKAIESIMQHDGGFVQNYKSQTNEVRAIEVRIVYRFLKL